MVLVVNIKKNMTILIRISSVILSCGILVYLYDFSESVVIFKNINYGFVVVSLVFLGVNQFLSSVRFKVSLSIFNVHLGMKVSHRVNIYSIISGLVFFNFLGQSLSRSYLIGNSLGRDASFFVTAIERVLSVSVLLVASIILSLMCFGGVSFDDAPALTIFVSFLFVFTSLGIFFIFSLNGKQFSEVSQIFSKSVGGGILRMFIITLMMHLFMLGSYLSLMAGVVGDGNITIFSTLACLLTMLGASLPISFGGWGVREVTAGFAFSAASMAPELGVGVGVGVGVLTMLALAVNVFLIWGGDFIRSPVKSFGFVRSENSAQTSRIFLSSLAWVLPTIIAVLMMVQIPVPIGSGKVMINFADPVAIVCGMTFFFVFFQRKMWSQVWKARFSNYALLGVILIVFLGYAIGYFRYGYLSWAFYNRLVGLGLLASYFVSGTAFFHFRGDEGFYSLSKVFFISISVMIVIEYLMRVVFHVDVVSVFGWDSPRWLGLFANPNAYAFFLLCCFPIIFIFSGFSKDIRSAFVSVIPAAIVLVAVYFTGSRAAYGALGVLVLFLSARFFRKLVLTIVVSFVLIAIFHVIPIVLEIIFSGINGSRFSYIINNTTVSGLLSVQGDRMLGVIEGWRMFLDYPLFGAGLGAFYHSQTNSGIPLVIHNSFLWVLAEFGVVGFIIIFVPIFIFAMKNLINYTWLSDDRIYALLAVLGGAAIMGMAHDIMYQRILWFVLGGLLAKPISTELGSHSLNSKELST